jgi:hypothetical protein
MSYVSTMILRSMRMIGEKTRGATLTSDEQSECLAEFNTFLDATGTERLLCYSLRQDSLALSTSTSTYTVGTNGDFSSLARPVKLVDPCFVRDSSGYDTPVTLVDAEQYGAIVDKDAGYTVPEYLYYDAGFSATSTATLHLYPVPTSGLTLFINSWTTLGSVSSLAQNLLLPPGYQLYLESNFAIHLAAGFKPISAELSKIARESKAAIQNVNLPAPVARLDSAVATVRGNILTGD